MPLGRLSHQPARPEPMAASEHLRPKGQKLRIYPDGRTLLKDDASVNL